MENLEIKMDTFNDECTVIDMKMEYEGYIGNEQYGIVTKLSEELLKEKYKDIIESYEPFLILPEGYLEILNEYRRNESKYLMRRQRYEDMYDVTNPDFANYHPECSTESAEIEFMFDEELAEIKEMLDVLTETEKRRVVLSVFFQMSYREISHKENVNFTAIGRSISSGLTKLKKFYK